MTLDAEPGVWFFAVLMLAFGAGLLVVPAILLQPRIRSAVWLRTGWQATLAAVWLLMLAELTGLSTALVSRNGARGTAARDACPPSRESPLTPDRKIASSPIPRLEPLGDRPHDGASENEGVPLEMREPAGVEENSDAEPAANVPVARTPSRPSIPAVHSSPLNGVKVLAWAWLVGGAVLLARVLWSRGLLLVFRTRQPAVNDSSLRTRVEAMARSLGVRRRVRLRESSRWPTPVVAGSLPAVVILPCGFTEEFNRREQDAMLAHELAHVAAWDPAWQLWADLLWAVLWWHPLIWLVRQRLRAASEAAADEACLLVPDGPGTLAACLVALGRRVVDRQPLGWLAVEGTGFRSALGRRVERLLNLPARPGRAPRARWQATVKIALSLGLVLVVVFGSAWARPQVVLEQGESTMGVLAKSWRHSLAAAMLVACWAPAATPAPAAEPEKPAVKEREAAKECPPAAREGERERGDRERGEREAKIRGLQERAEQFQRELRGLKPEQREQGERIEQQLREIREKMHDLLAAGREMPDRERVMRRLEELKQALGRAREAGRRDEVERLERQMHEVTQALRGPERPGPREMPPQDVERRLRALRAAVENLREGGFNDLADRLQREAEGMARRPGEQRRPEGPPEAVRGEMERVVRELRGDMQRMQRQLEEMREQMKHLAEPRRGEK
jgi:hypothetical protein